MRQIQQLLVAEYQPATRSAKCREIVRVKQVAEESKGKVPLLSAADSTGSKKRYTVTLELTEEEMEVINQAQVMLSTRKVKDNLLKSAKKIIQHQNRLTGLREKRVIKTKQKSSASPVRKSHLHREFWFALRLTYTSLQTS